MIFSHDFTLYLNGSKKDIAAFKQEVKKILDKDEDTTYNLYHSPVSLKTFRVQASSSHEVFNDFIPVMKMFPELCLTAVQEDGGLLRYVPEAQRTAEICFAAIKQFTYDEDEVEDAMELVPDELKAEVRSMLDKLA